MSVLQHIRTNYRDYDDLSDSEVVRLWNKKFHPNQDIDEINEFYADKKEQARQDEFSFFGGFTRGVERGIGGIHNLFTQGGLRGLYEYATGDYEEAQKRFETYQDAEAELNVSKPAVIDYREIDGDNFAEKMIPKDFKAAEDLKDFALGAIGQVTTDVAGGGLAGVAAKTGAKLTAKNAARLLSKKLSQKQLDKVGRIATQFGRTGYFGAQNFGEVYNEVYKATDGDVDMMKVVMHGTINTALDRILPENVLNKMSRQGRQQVVDYAFKRLMKGIGKGALIEGGTEATQQLSVELAKTDGWDYLENISQVDIEAIEAALAQGIFGGGTIKGGVDLAFGTNPEAEAKTVKSIEDAALDANLRIVQERGGLTEPTIPTKPTVENEMLQEEFDEKKPKKWASPKLGDSHQARMDRELFKATHGESIWSYKDRIDREKKSAWEKKLKANKKIRKQNEKTLKEFDQEQKSFKVQQAERETDVFQDSQKYINDRLQSFRDKGEQGLKIAESLEQEMTKKDVSPIDLVTAFNSAEILNEILPQSSDLTVEFVRSLTHEDGPAQGTYNPSAKLLSLAYDVGARDQEGLDSLGVKGVREMHESTASHEAFHVLQQFFGQHDKGAQSILDSTFGSLGKSVDYLKSPVRKWIKRLDPEMDLRLQEFNKRPVKQTAEASGQIESQENQGILGSELQAYAFQTYAKARREGKTPVMGGRLARYFGFLYKFLTRMGNSLMGRGFRNSQDVFDAATKGALAKSFVGKGISNQQGSQNANEASALEAVARSMKARERRETPTGFWDKDYTRPITEEDAKKGESRVRIGNESVGVMVALEPRGQKVEVKMKKGFNGFDKSDNGRNFGYGLEHIRAMHGFKIAQLGYDKIGTFVRDTMFYGTPKKQKTSPTEEPKWRFTHRPPGGKERVVVVGKRKDGHFVYTAYVSDEGIKDRGRTATEEDIEAYRASRASALEISPDRISTRIPSVYLEKNEKTGKRNTDEDIASKKGTYEDPYQGDLSVGYEEVVSDPKLVDRLGDFFRNFVSQNRLEKGEVETYTLFNKEQLELPNDQMIEAFVEATKKNLLFIYDNVRDEIKAVSKLWYDGANKISKDIASAYGTEFQRVAGVMAALSPQKDWFMNISLGERVVDIYTNQRDAKVSDSMLEYMLTKTTDTKGQKKSKYSVKGDFVFNSPKDKANIDYIQKHRPSIRDLENPSNFQGASPTRMRAMILRAYDEVNNSKNYYVVSPNGSKGDFARKKDGELENIGWQSFDNIAKALDVMDAPTANLNRTIALRMGGAHKVRNFYNNIVDPNGKMKDVTVDTHAIAAAFLKPLGSSSVEVLHGLNGSALKNVSRGAPGSAPKGLQGTYALIAEGHRRAALERGVLPREMQSITWEAVREVFTDTFKKDKIKTSKIDSIWKDHQDGNISFEEAQRSVINETEGFRDPIWASQPNNANVGRDGQATNVGELVGSSVRPEDGQRQFIGRSDRSDTRGTQGRTGSLSPDEASLVEEEKANWGDGIQASSLPLIAPTPKKTVTAYKLFRTLKSRPGELFPLYVRNKEAVPEGVWLKAQIGEAGKIWGKVKSSLGDLAFRPGWHAGDLPRSTHIGGKSKGKVQSKPDYRRDNEVWAEVELAADKDWQPIANSRMKGKDRRTAHITDRIPDGGFYRYKTNANMEGEWLIGGAMKVVRVLTDAEVKAINTVKGVADLPRLSELSEASSLNVATSFDDVIANSHNDSFVNKFLNGLQSLTPSGWGKSFVTEFIDAYHPIKVVEEELSEKTTGIRRLKDGVNSVYKYIEMLGNTSGRREIILKRGAPVLMEDGSITIDESTKGLMEIFGRLESSQEKRAFTEYAYAKRALALKEKERLIGPELIRQGLAHENAKFKEMFEDYQAFNRGMLTFLAKSGLISKKERANLAKYDYIPFYREIQEEFDKRTGTLREKQLQAPQVTSQVLNNPSAKLKAYKGGQAPIGDLVDNTIRNASIFIDQGMKNVAMQKATKLFEESGIGRSLKATQAKQVGKSINYVTYKVDGKNKYYDVEDPLLYASIASMTPRQSSGLLKHMETVARYFREFITHQPAFMVANYMRGEMAGLVTVDAKVTPIADSLKGFMNSMRNSKSIEEMKLNGGVGGYTFGDTSRDSAKAFERDLRLRNMDYTIVNSPQAISDMVTKMWGGLTKVGEASELAYRDGVYRTLREQGKSKSEASYEALNVINFNRRGAMRSGFGSALGALIPLVPFLNARIQGLYRTFDPMVTGRQADRRKTLLYGSMLTLASLALYSEASDDERYEQEDLHLRLNYHIFYIGDRRYLIPRAFEVGAIFTTIPEFIMQSIKDGESEELQKVALMTLLNTFSFNPTPQAIKPIIEVATNYDMFRQSYIDSPNETNYKPSARYGASTPEVSKWLSEKTESIFGLSPNMITKLITGYLGSMGTTMLIASDVALSRGDSTPTRPLGVFGDGALGLLTEATGFGRFVKDELYTGNKFIRNFYDTKKDIDQIYNTINRYKKDGQLERAREIFKENRSSLRFRDTLNKLNKSLQEINTHIRRIKTHPDMSPEDKRSKLIMLINRRNKIGRHFDKIHDKIKATEK